MPLIGSDMADEFTEVIGITVVRGQFTTWTEMHRSNFHIDPESSLMPRLMGDHNKELHGRWMQWHTDSMIEVREDVPPGGRRELEMLVMWGGVSPMKVLESSCRTCIRPGLIIPVLSSMCWPMTAADYDTRAPWDYVFPAAHISTEIANSHDRDYTIHRTMVDDTWTNARDSGQWTPYTEEDEGTGAWKKWDLSDLYENGYEDVVEQIEEEVSQSIKEKQSELHCEPVFLPRRIREHWGSVLQYQVRHHVTRRNPTARNISEHTAEGFNRWQGVTGH